MEDQRSETLYCQTSMPHCETPMLHASSMSHCETVMSSHEQETKNVNTTSKAKVRFWRGYNAIVWRPKLQFTNTCS